MSTTRLSPDAKAVVRVAEQLTEQVRRIADALEASDTMCSSTATMTVVDTPVTPGVAIEPDSPSTDASADDASDDPSLREQLADAIGRTNLAVWPKADRYEAADAVLAVLQPGIDVVSGVVASARATAAAVERVTRLHSRWTHVGTPPVGTSISLWWDLRLSELGNALFPPDADTDHSADPS
ncbi:hypothetical protein ACWEQC_06845 [Streptomyces shenzhenensis]